MITAILLASLLARPLPVHTPRHRSVVVQFMRQTHHPHGWTGHVVDHILPLACGGPDTPNNMQWQSIVAARAKDLWEIRGDATHAPCSGSRR